MPHQFSLCSLTATTSTYYRTPRTWNRAMELAQQTHLVRTTNRPCRGQPKAWSRNRTRQRLAASLQVSDPTPTALPDDRENCTDLRFARLELLQGRTVSSQKNILTVKSPNYE